MKTVILLVLFCAILGAAGQIFFKLAANQFGLSVQGLLLNWKLIVGVTLYALATLLFVYALKFGEVSYIYPLIATSYIWVTLFAAYFLGEALSWTKLIGTLIIVAGIAIIVK